MPHEPGHVEYKIVGTGELYDGKVVKIGQDFFTSAGGGIEGDRQRVEVLSAEERPSVDRDVVTTFKVGVTPADMFFHPVFSNQVYYYQNGTQIPSGTELHHHTIPARGDNEFMTQHTMDGAENVFTTQPNVGVPPNNNTRVNNRAQQRNQTRTQTGTTRRTTNGGTVGGIGGSSNNNPGGNVGGGNTGGGMGGGSY